MLNQHANAMALSSTLVNNLRKFCVSLYLVALEGRVPVSYGFHAYFNYMVAAFSGNIRRLKDILDADDEVTVTRRLLNLI